MALIIHPSRQAFFAFSGCFAPIFMLTMVVTAEPKEEGSIKHMDVMLLAIPCPFKTTAPYFSTSLLIRKKPKLSIRLESMAGKPIRSKVRMMVQSKRKPVRTKRSPVFFMNNSKYIHPVIKKFDAREAMTEPTRPQRNTAIKTALNNIFKISMITIRTNVSSGLPLAFFMEL